MSHSKETYTDIGSLKLDGRELIPDYSMFSRTPFESNLSIQDAGAEPSERSLSRFAWKRTSSEFSYGAGQEWFDQEDDNIRQRYYEAIGTSFKDHGYLSSVDAPLQETTSTTTVGTQILAAGGNGVGWWVNGTQISKLTNAGQTRAISANLPGGNITGLTVLDGKAVIADGSGIYTSTEAANDFVTQLGSLTPDYFVQSASRLLGLEGNSLYEISADGTKLGGANIFDHPSTNFVFKGGVVAPNGVYLYGDDGRNVDIYLLVPVDSTGEFAPPFPATPWPVGEIINAIDQFGGVLAIATNRGIRLANITGSGFLSYGPVLDDVGPVTCLSNDGEYLYGGVSFDHFLDHEYANGTEYTGLVRFKLSKFTDTLVPAWESSLVTSLGSGSTVEGCAVLWSQSGAVRTDTLIFAADGATSTDRELWVSDATTVQSPIIFRPGHVTYGTPEDKAFVSIDIVIEGLSALDTVVCVLDCEGDSTTLDGEQVGTSATWRFISNKPLVCWAFDPTFTITLDTPASHARVRIERWTMRTLVKPEKIEVVQVGIICDTETRSGVQRGLPDPYDDWLFMQNLAESKEIVTLQIGSRIEAGYVDAVIAPEGEIKEELARAESGNFVQGTWVLRFVAAADAPI